MLKQIFCRHDYRPWANIYGDLVDDFNGNRTIYICRKCCKRKYIKAFIAAPLNANNIWRYIASEKQGDPFSDLHLNDIIKDKKQYTELFDKAEPV